MPHMTRLLPFLPLSSSDSGQLQSSNCQLLGYFKRPHQPTTQSQNEHFKSFFPIFYVTEFEIIFWMVKETLPLLLLLSLSSSSSCKNGQKVLLQLLMVCVVLRKIAVGCQVIDTTSSQAAEVRAPLLVKLSLRGLKGFFYFTESASYILPYFCRY